MPMWRAALILTALLVAGCITPVEISAALEAPLSPDGTPFLVLASSCDATSVTTFILYPNGTLYHVSLDAAAAARTPPHDARMTRAEVDEAVRDAAATGAFDARPFTDAQGHLRSSHAEKSRLDGADFDDLRRRVTLAGFPALDEAYGASGCVDHYTAWADGAHRHARDHGDAAPWVLRHVGDGLRELHPGT
jgi:hypothetical protein